VRSVILYLISEFLRGKLTPMKLVKDLDLLFHGLYPIGEVDFCTKCLESIEVVRQELIALACQAVNLPYNYDYTSDNSVTDVENYTDQLCLLSLAQEAVTQIIDELTEDLEDSEWASELRHETYQVIDSLLLCDEVTVNKIGIIINCLQLTSNRVIIPMEAALLVETVIPRKKDLSQKIYSCLCKFYGSIDDDASDSDEEPTPMISAKSAVIASDQYKNERDQHLKTICDQRKFRASMIIRIESCINELQYFEYDRGYRWTPTPFLISTMKQCFGVVLTTDIVTNLLTAPVLYTPVVLEALMTYLKEIETDDNESVGVDPFKAAVEQLAIQELKVQPEAGAKINREGFMDAPINRFRHICPGFGQGGELPWHVGRTLRTFIHDGLIGRSNLASAVKVKKFIETLLQIFRGDELKLKVLKIRTTQIEPFLRFFRLFYMLSSVGMDISLYQCNHFGNIMDKEAKTMIDARAAILNNISKRSDSGEYVGLMEYIFRGREPNSNIHPRHIIKGRLRCKLKVWADLCDEVVSAIYPLVASAEDRSLQTAHHNGSTRPLLLGDLFSNDIQLSYDDNKIVFTTC